MLVNLLLITCIVVGVWCTPVLVGVGVYGLFTRTLYRT